MTHLMNFAINMKLHKQNWIGRIPYCQQWVVNWLNSLSAPMIGTPNLKVTPEAIEAKNHMTQALMLIGGVHQDLQVLKVQATMIPHQDLRVMDRTMNQLQDLPTTLRVTMTQFQGLHNKDPSMMTLRQELRKMQVNMAPLIEPQDKKM